MDITPRIAVFDSGIGGTGVLEAIRILAPWSDLVYIADHAFGPYGEQSLGAVRDRTEVLARYLVTAGVELVVIACNSASAAALHHLRDAIPDIPFVGMEPAVKPAAEGTRTGVVGVLATGATFQGELFRDLVGRHATDVVIVEQACPGLAAAIEAGDDVGPLLDRFLPPVLEAGADVVVLGCTHYPHIRDLIQERVGPEVTLIDPAPAVARRTVDVARSAGIDLAGMGAQSWWTTSPAARPVPDRVWESIDIPAKAMAAVRVGDATLSAVAGDITAMSVDAIVNAANTQLRHGGGVALAIARAGGPVIDEESAAWVREYGPLEPGVAALTSAGALPSSYVIHVAGPIHEPGAENAELLAAATLAALDLGTEIGASTIAMPAISAGIYGYPPDEATAVIAETTAEFLTDRTSSLRSVRLVGYDDAMAARFAEGLHALELG
jgi:glutamate racemase